MTELANVASTETSMSRTDHAVRTIAKLAASAHPEARLGTKRELQEWCRVSKGTFNEALRILQSRGVIALRPGPGGGLFVGTPTPIARLGNSILSLDAAQGDVSDAVRIRDALDPLLVDDALYHSAAVDIDRMRCSLAEMKEAIDHGDATAFVRANWGLHATIARISPNGILKSIYLGLLELIESHTLSIEPADGKPLWDYIDDRYQLHADLVDALANRDRDNALRLIHEHNMTQGGSD